MLIIVLVSHQYRQKLREAQSTRVTSQKTTLAHRRDDTVRIDRRIAELQDRLHRKRLLNQQLAATLKNQVSSCYKCTTHSQVISSPAKTLKSLFHDGLAISQENRAQKSSLYRMKLKSSNNQMNESLYARARQNRKVYRIHMIVILTFHAPVLSRTLSQLGS